VIPLKDDNPVARWPAVTAALIAANVLAFLWQVRTGLPASVLRGGAIPFEILTFADLVDPFDPAQPGLPALVPPPLTVLTSMFLHGGLVHLGGNMLFLWTFGNNVEDAIGRARFLLFYLGTGVVAALAQVALSVVSGDLFTPMVGASGAVSGVLGAYLVLYPRARVLTLVPIFVFIRLIWLPATFFLLFWFTFQLIPMLLGGVGGGGGVAYMAHVGGFAAGWLYTKITGGRVRWVRPRRAWWT
jgi:membrane associated rhomboid family serine protease